MYSSTIATRKTAASTPDKLCPHIASALNRQLWLRQALSALNATHYDHKRNPYRWTNARFCSAFGRRAWSSLCNTAGASWNTRATGFQVLSASYSSSQANLTTNAACSPLDGLDALDVVLALVLN